MPKRPNIIFILADDMGYGDFACFNYGLSHTPHLDALIRESVCLTQHYSASPLCAPARASLFTGRYPLRTGVIDTICLSRKDCLSTRERTIGDIFKQAGYATGCIGKWHCGSVERKYHPNERGFDEFLGFRAGWNNYFDYRVDRNGIFEKSDGTYMTDLLTKEAVSFVRRHKNEPFFLHLAYSAPHAPYEALEADLKPFVESGRHTPGVSHIYAMIKRMDEGVGRVLEALRQEGLDENTIVIFSSDNGPQFGGDGDWKTDRFNCGFRGAKGSVYEGGIRVPLMVRWPDGLEGGRHFHDVVHFTDWLPTLAAATGIELPTDLCLDGQNVLAALRGEGAQKLNTKRFWQWSRSVPVITHNAAMRDGDWKLVLPGDDLANTFPGWERDLALYEDVDMNPEKYIGGVPDGTGGAPCVGVEPGMPQLFNLAADPLEVDDQAALNPDRVRRMKNDLENWFEEVERDRSTVTDKPYCFVGDDGNLKDGLVSRSFVGTVDIAPSILNAPSG